MKKIAFICMNKIHCYHMHDSVELLCQVYNSVHKCLVLSHFVCFVQAIKVYTSLHILKIHSVPLQLTAYIKYAPGNENTYRISKQRRLRCVCECLQYRKRRDVIVMFKWCHHVASLCIVSFQYKLYLRDYVCSCSSKSYSLCTLAKIIAATLELYFFYSLNLDYLQ